jgi:hypothetical protein
MHHYLHGQGLGKVLLPQADSSFSDCSRTGPEASLACLSPVSKAHRHPRPRWPPCSPVRQFDSCPRRAIQPGTCIHLLITGSDLSPLRTRTSMLSRARAPRVPVLRVARRQQRSLVSCGGLSRRSPSVLVDSLITAQSSKLAMPVRSRSPAPCRWRSSSPAGLARAQIVLEQHANGLTNRPTPLAITATAPLG